MPGFEPLALGELGARLGEVILFDQGPGAVEEHLRRRPRIRRSIGARCLRPRERKRRHDAEEASRARCHCEDASSPRRHSRPPKSSRRVRVVVGVRAIGGREEDDADGVDEGATVVEAMGAMRSGASGGPAAGNGDGRGADDSAGGAMAAASCIRIGVDRALRPRPAA